MPRRPRVKNPSKPRGLDDRAYRKATARLRSRSDVCHLCGGPIDTTLPYTHPRSWTADHLIPRSRGGHLLGEMKAAHRDCNAKRGNKPLEAGSQLPWSREWLPGGRAADDTAR
ncbi:HNH endonuclease [Nocardia salmonicida]|uniref:HNH endonuclease n=1 Tax=Nocardia salmonicida TaxID=53431 RepID=UPI00340C0AC1